MPYEIDSRVMIWEASLVWKRAAKSSIATRLIIFILVSQTILYAAFAFLIMHSSEETVQEAEKLTFRLLENTVRWSIEDEINSAMLSVTAVSTDHYVQDIFARRDREALLEYLSPLYSKISDQVIRFHFHLPDGTSFLRIHKPDAYGDNLLDLRPMVAAALSSREIISGIELGKDGLGIRVITPVYQDESYLGALEYGMEFGDAFIRKLRDKQEADYYLFTFNPVSYIELMAGTLPLDRCQFADDTYEEILQNQSVWSLDCSKARAVGMYPFLCYSGEVLGFIKVELQRIPLSDSLSAIRRRLIFLGIILVLVLGITVITAIRLLLKPLKTVVEKTRRISERIIGGDLEYRGDMDSMSPDFRHVIEAVNNIIATLREREILLQAIVEGIPGIVYYVDKTYRVLWANKQAQKLIPGIIGNDARKARTGFFEKEEELLEEVFRTGRTRSIQACYTSTTEKNNCLDCTTMNCWEHIAVPVKNQRGEITSLIRIASNITDKHKAEAALRKLNEVLERRVEEEIEKRKVGEYIANQQSRLASIGELATGIAHEITQPLNAVSFAIVNLRNNYDGGRLTSEYMRNKINGIVSDIERVRRVIDHVRLFARSAPREYQASFSVNACIENALALIGTQLSTHGIELELGLDPLLPEVYGNSYQYEQVVLNLLSNARDAVNGYLNSREFTSDGHVLIRTSRRGGNAVMEISDNGTGIDKDNIDKVFDPFYTSKAPGEGTGLGLSISFGIIRDMGGTIELQALGQGTRARVTVPIDEAGNKKTAAPGAEDAS